MIGSITEAKAALDTARTYIEQAEQAASAQVNEEVAGHMAIIHARMEAFVLSLLSEVPIPISYFRAFASYEQFRVWEKAKQLTLQRINRKVCIAPRTFFEFWETQAR